MDMTNFNEVEKRFVHRFMHQFWELSDKWPTLEDWTEITDDRKHIYCAEYGGTFSLPNVSDDLCRELRRGEYAYSRIQWDMDGTGRQSYYILNPRNLARFVHKAPHVDTHSRDELFEFQDWAYIFQGI